MKSKLGHDPWLGLAPAPPILASPTRLTLAVGLCGPCICEQTGRHLPEDTDAFKSPHQAEETGRIGFRPVSESLATILWNAPAGSG
jgi:hypothetical protein